MFINDYQQYSFKVQLRVQPLVTNSDPIPSEIGTWTTEKNVWELSGRVVASVSFIIKNIY